MLSKKRILAIRLSYVFDDLAKENTFVFRNALQSWYNLCPMSCRYDNHF
jgi:hypothetical protein